MKQGYAIPARSIETHLLLDAVDREVRSTFERYAPDAQEFSAMVAYHLGWADLGQPPAQPGKRVRALLTLLSASAAGGDWADALPLAAAVELLHNFSLVHDDIQDGAMVRRGRPSVWAKWGAGHAINAGDTLFALAHLAVQRASSLPAQQRLMAVELLDEACVKLGEGQYRDMAFEKRTDVSVTDYMGMATGKTATLTGLAAEFGGLAVNAEGRITSCLKEFGLHIGLAFQIRDDILGIWGEPASIGKPRSDINGRKMTLPVIYGLAESPELRRRFEAVEDDGIGVPDVVQLLEQTDARTHSLRDLEYQVGLALDYLDAARPGKEAGNLLRQLALSLLTKMPGGAGPIERPSVTMGPRREKARAH
ncbi:MAG: polyprenyl synthetase family protein [Dehalococcoidia bacterium]